MQSSLVLIILNQTLLDASHKGIKQLRKRILIIEVASVLKLKQLGLQLLVHVASLRDRNQMVVRGCKLQDEPLMASNGIPVPWRAEVSALPLALISKISVVSAHLEDNEFKTLE